MKKNKDILIDAIGNIDDKYIKEAHDNKKKVFSFSWELTGKLLTGALCLFLLISFVPNLFRAGKSQSTDAVNETAHEYDNGFSTGTTYDVAEEEYDGDNILANKKIIVTGYINIETLDFDSLIEQLNMNIAEAGGYIQSSSISTNRYDSRYFDAVIRIPADKYDDFLTKTKQTGNVTWYNENLDDITETYTDLEARLNSLKAEETKVLEFYDKATNLDELMSIESRLTDIRYEIDSIQTSIKNYDTLINYSTLNINVQETKAYTKSNDKFFNRLGLSFRNGLTNFVNSIQDFMIDIAYNILQIVLVVVVLVAIVVVIKRIRKNKN